MTTPLFLQNAWQTFVPFFLGGLLSLATITNAPSKIPLFIGLTEGMDGTQRRRLARRACLYAFALLAVTLFAGHGVLELFGISYAALRIAGGLTIALLGYRMLFGSVSDSLYDTHAQRRNVAFFPLALPSISGPGAIAVTLGISSEIAELKTAGAKVVAHGATLLSLAIVMIVMWAVLRSANLVGRKLGEEGMEALTRLTGFLLVCVGVQLVGSGIRAFVAAG